MKVTILPNSRVSKSPKREQIIQAITAHSNLTSRQLWEDFVLPLDNTITLNIFQNWLRLFRKEIDKQSSKAVEQAVVKATLEKLDRVGFESLVDGLVQEKINDPEARAEMSLKEALDMKIGTEKLKQKDEEIKIKKNEDERQETAFNMMIASVMSGETDEDFIDSMNLNEPALISSEEEAST